MKISKTKLFLNMAKREMNIKQLSEASGLTRQTISAVNNGKSCSAITAGKLARGLKVDVAELLED